MRAALGTDERDLPVAIDIDSLLRTRLLLTASSGGGKSWLLRRLAEQIFGHVQVVIIDPEGEFATLRERYGYVLVGKGGETPADTRSAALVAHKLLELNASAVCDLFEMPPAARSLWVKLFLDALIDAPKRLWRPLVVIVDEAHVFAPERGDSTATDAVVALATRGRKRGFAAVLATQRLAKLRKDVAAECGNVLIGRTMLDVDRDRAVDALGIGGGKGDKAAFSAQIKLLKPGGFYALGPALCDSRTLVRVGPVLTSHHEPGSSKHAAEAPPTPDKVKRLLPQLADLPKEAETKARTEAELRGEIAALKRELAAKPAPPAAEVRTVERPVLTEEQAKLLASLDERMTALPWDFKAVAEDLDALRHEARQVIEQVAGLRSAIAAAVAPQRAASPALAPRASAGSVPPTRAQRQATAAPARRAGEGGDALGGVERRILAALAELETLGVPEPERAQVALLAGYGHLNSKGLVNGLGALRSAGLIDYPAGGCVAMTQAGRDVAEFPTQPRSSAEIQERVIAILGGASERLLRPLIQAYPMPLAREALADAAGYGHLNSKGFVNAIGRLRSLGFIDYPARGRVVARDILFLGER